MVRGKGRESVRILRALLASYQRQPSIEFPRTDRVGGMLGTVIAQARLPISTVRLWIALALAGGVGVLVLAGVWACMLFLALALVVAWLRLWRLAKANCRAIDRDLPALLTAIASSARAGIDPLSALLSAREYLHHESPLLHEVEKIRSGLSGECDEESLLGSFLMLYPSQEGELFKRCLIISRRHGSSLAEPLHRITKVVRQRQSFRRKIKAALAMHRMSAIGIALCATVMAGLQIAMNPGAVHIAVYHPMGGKLLIAGVSLIVAGVVWMMMMGREVASR